jgi:hypothetical protein
MTSPLFRIIVWPDAVENDLDSLLAPRAESGGVPGTPKYLRQRRGWNLNIATGISGLPHEIIPWFVDDTRAEPKFTIPAGAVKVLDIKNTKPLFPNPAYIGP